MDPLDDLEMLSDAADILFSLENVKQSKFKKIFFQVINEQKKLEKVKYPSQDDGQIPVVVTPQNPFSAQKLNI